MIKSAKKAIYRVLGSSNVTDEELITAVAGVESLVNSWPLTYQTTDPRDVVPLTPNHFPHGQLGGQFGPETIDTTEISPRKRWRKVGYRSTFHCWTEVVIDLKKNDIRLVLEPNLPRGQWPLGRITETYPGRDGHTRVPKIHCETHPQSCAFTRRAWQRAMIMRNERIFLY